MHNDIKGTPKNCGNYQRVPKTLLGHEIEVFTDYNNLTYETIESAYQHLQRWNTPIKEFGVTLLYIKGEYNLFANYFIRLTTAHHANKLENKTLEEDTCKLLCLYLLLIFDNTDCFYIYIEEISFPLDPQIVEAEQKLEPQDESSTNIRIDLNKANSNWKYKLYEGINLVHYRNKIYVPKTICKRVLKWYHCYLQHTGGDILAQALTTVCRWPGIDDQSRKLCRTCKDCQKFKKRNYKYGLLPV